MSIAKKAVMVLSAVSPRDLLMRRDLVCQMLSVKGCDRDSVWYGIMGKEWPVLEQAFQIWLAADNFDADRVRR